MITAAMRSVRHTIAILWRSSSILPIWKAPISEKRERHPFTDKTGIMNFEEAKVKVEQLTKELKIPVLCLAQMNRDYEKRVDSKPQNSDLRESGKIEQDAHVIMFLYQKSKAISFKGADEILCGITKNRSGKSGSVPFLFYKDQCRFEEKSYETGMRATFTGISSVSE